MGNFKKFISKYKFVTIFLVLLIILVIIVLKFVIPNYKEDSYGNRTAGIEKHSISDSDVSSLKKDIKSLEKVKKVTYDLKGRLINVIIEVDSTLEKATAITYADKVLEYFDDDIKSYYDIQVYLDSDDSEVYPLIGYKNKNSKGFIWNKN